MKVKLLMLLGMMVVSLLSVGQTSKPVFFNKGKMSIISTSADSTVLYVDGDFIVGRDATDPNTKSEIYVEKSKTIITGDFVQNTSYIDGNQGTVFKDYATDYDSKRAKFVFKGTGPQKITTTLTPYNSLRKGNNYINFPDIEIDNKNHVTMSPEIAASVQNLILTKGKLILDSRRMNATDVTSSSSLTDKTSTLLAHLMVPAKTGTERITYNRNTSGVTDLNELGVVQVKLQLDDPTTFDGTFATERTRSLIGMGSPFEEIKADYFMWNFLMFPYDNNIIGSLNTTETDPRTTIKAGRGIALGVDLRGTTASDYTGTVADDYTSTSFADRMNDMYTFDRLAFNNNNNIYPLSDFSLGNTAYTSQSITSDAYRKEKLVYNDLTVDLENGFNYLSNPFTAPLNLKRLLDAGGDVADNPWGVVPNSNVNATGAARDIMNRVWILNPSSSASGKFNLDNGSLLGKEKIYVSYTYLLMKNVGGTYSSEYNNGSGDDYTIAPLQMFVIYAPTLGTRKKITIPASERVISTASHFLRSTTDAEIPADDYLFEVTDLTTKVYDRAAIVLRTPDEIMTNASYGNVKKLVSSVTSDTQTKSTIGLLTEEGSISQGANSIIYTKDSEGQALESYFLPAPEAAESVSTPLYLTPSIIAQDISIAAKRLSTMDKAQSIWLEDKLTKKSFELSNGGEYVTSVQPTDDADRFKVTFVLKSTSGIDPGDNGSGNKSLNSYYSNGQLTVTGFDASDMGSVISVYDIQGRMIAQAKVDQDVMTIKASFYAGAYIVKVVGNKSYVSKFLVR